MFARRPRLGWRSFVIRMDSIPSGPNSTFISQKIVTTWWAPKRQPPGPPPPSSSPEIVPISKNKAHNIWARWNRTCLVMCSTYSGLASTLPTPNKKINTPESCLPLSSSWPVSFRWANPENSDFSSKSQKLDTIWISHRLRSMKRRSPSASLQNTPKTRIRFECCATGSQCG